MSRDHSISILIAPEIADDTLGGRISLARDFRGLSIEEASAVAGVMAETWSNWENDRAEPRSNSLDRLAGILQVSVTWLIHGKGWAELDP